MLEQPHIALYWERVISARSEALGNIQEAHKKAKESKCGGCTYCHSTKKHELVLEQTYQDLLGLLRLLKPGTRSSTVFSKSYMNHDLMLYRGFILDTGEYQGLSRSQEHSTYRKEYALIHGEERAWRLINVHARGEKNCVIFCDRKSAPSQAQYDTLLELMKDAEGNLSFRFDFDTRHPSKGHMA
jgi:hypothetical protein